jgi:hypothetical protein
VKDILDVCTWELEVEKTRLEVESSISGTRWRQVDGIQMV